MILLVTLRSSGEAAFQPVHLWRDRDSCDYNFPASGEMRCELAAGHDGPCGIVGGFQYPVTGFDPVARRMSVLWGHHWDRSPPSARVA